MHTIYDNGTLYVKLDLAERLAKALEDLIQTAEDEFSNSAEYADFVEQERSLTQARQTLAEWRGE